MQVKLLHFWAKKKDFILTFSTCIGSFCNDSGWSSLQNRQFRTHWAKKKLRHYETCLIINSWMISKNFRRILKGICKHANSIQEFKYSFQTGLNKFTVDKNSYREWSMMMKYDIFCNCVHICLIGTQVFDTPISIDYLLDYWKS